MNQAENRRTGVANVFAFNFSGFFAGVFAWWTSFEHDCIERLR
jgi:hypothetical protein